LETKITKQKPYQQPAPALWFHFDGSIAENHRLSLRALGKTANHLQSAIDRAYLDVKYNDVFKYQKLKKDEYEDVEFIALDAQEGGYILEAVAQKTNEMTRAIMDRFNSAIVSAYDKDVSAGENESKGLIDQANLRSRVFKSNNEADTYDDFVSQELNQLSRSYGERSINKEVDQVLSLIRIDQFEDSIFEIQLYGTSSGPKLTFDKNRATRFHKVISERRVGTPLICELELRSLDAGGGGQASRGKAKNLASGKECTMLIPDPKVFGKLASHLRRIKRKRLKVVACPIYEYDAWDPKGGDIVVIEFIEVLEDE
jgi:hypothetical protein